MIPRYSSYSIRHIEGECRDLEAELWSFPKSINDDAMDAEAYQLQIAEPPHKQKKSNSQSINRGKGMRGT